MEKATPLSQEELRAPKNRNSNTKTLPLVLAHNPNNSQIINRIKQNLQFLKNSEKIKPILENTKLIVSRRQPKNLKKQLTQARFVSERTSNTVTQCGEPRCGTVCNHNDRNRHQIEKREDLVCKMSNELQIA